MPPLFIHRANYQTISVYIQHISTPEREEPNVADLLDYLKNNPSKLEQLGITTPLPLKLYLPNGIRLNAGVPLSQLPKNTNQNPLILKPQGVMLINLVDWLRFAGAVFTILAISASCAFLVYWFFKNELATGLSGVTSAIAAFVGAYFKPLHNFKAGCQEAYGWRKTKGIVKRNAGYEEGAARVNSLPERPSIDSFYSARSQPSFEGTQ